MALYTKSGTHELAVKFNDMYDEMKEIEKELECLKDEHRKTLHPIYSCYVNPIDDEHIRIEAVLENPEIFDEHLNIFGSLSNPPEERRLSVEYYRVNNVLLYKHGGWILLKKDAICSDADWHSLLNGIVPAELLND